MAEDDVETLAERVEWARGTELTAVLEELEAAVAADPGAAGPASIPALMRLVAAPEEAGPEATRPAASGKPGLTSGRTPGARQTERRGTPRIPRVASTHNTTHATPYHERRQRAGNKRWRS